MKRQLPFLFLILLTAVLFFANLFFGSIHIEPGEVWEALWNISDDDAISFIVRGSRLPAATTALFSGAALGCAGLMLQTLFRNPLAGPSILGISSGAGLGVAVVILLFGGSFALGSASLGITISVVVAAIAGSMAVMALLIFFSTFITNNLMLLITGIMAGYLTSSIVTLLSSFASAEGIQGYVLWGMGTFNSVTTDSLPVFVIVLSIVLLLSLILSKPLNLLTMGYDYARSLGLNIKMTRNSLLVISSLLTAVVTAWCGPISFIGLAIPHIARMIFRTDNHLLLLPATMLCGAAVALACNVASTIPQNSIIPINALTPLFGVPVILYIMLAKRR